MKNTKSTIEITFNRCGKCTSLDDLYILIFCYYDFILYNNEKPDYHYPLIENPATVFCNHSTKHSGVAKPLVVRQKNGKDYLDFASSNHKTNEDDKNVSKKFAKLANIESDYSFYSSSNNKINDENEVNKIDDLSAFEIDSNDYETKTNIDSNINDDFNDIDLDLCDIAEEKSNVSDNQLSKNVFDDDFGDEYELSDQKENSQTTISSNKTYDDEQIDQNVKSQTNKILSTDDEEKSNSDHTKDYDSSGIYSTSNNEIHSDFLEEYSDDQYVDKKSTNSSSTNDEDNLNDINQSTHSLNIDDEKIFINSQSEDSINKRKIMMKKR